MKTLETKTKKSIFRATLIVAGAALAVYYRPDMPLFWAIFFGMLLGYVISRFFEWLMSI